MREQHFLNYALNDAILGFHEHFGLNLIEEIA